jgi:hypothetical protein
VELFLSLNAFYLLGSMIRQFVDHNHSHVEVYKKLLKEKDKELQQVHNRLRRMMMAWNRGQLMKKSNWLEKNSMQAELDRLRFVQWYSDVLTCYKVGIVRKESGNRWELAILGG